LLFLVVWFGVFSSFFFPFFFLFLFSFSLPLGIFFFFSFFFFGSWEFGAVFFLLHVFTSPKGVVTRWWLTVIGKADLKHRYQSNLISCDVNQHWGGQSHQGHGQGAVACQPRDFWKIQSGFKKRAVHLARELLRDRRFRRRKVLLHLWGIVRRGLICLDNYN
jgi:hypothetical protein